MLRHFTVVSAPIFFVATPAFPADVAISSNEMLWLSVDGLKVDGVREALSRGADPNAQIPKGWDNLGFAKTPLDAVCETLRFSGLAFFSESHPEYPDKSFLVDTFDTHPGHKTTTEALVYDVAKTRAAEIAEVLFSKGGKWTEHDMDCATAVGATKLVTVLLEHGVKPSIWGQYSDTEYAKKYGREDIYRLLVTHGGEAVDDRTAKQLALIDAAETADVDKMADAVRLGATTNEPIRNGEMALCAVLQGRPPERYKQYVAIWWLLDHGAKPGTECDSRYTISPLQIFVDAAQRSNNSPEIQFLLRETLARFHGPDIR